MVILVSAVAAVTVCSSYYGVYGVLYERSKGMATLEERGWVDPGQPAALACQGVSQVPNWDLPPVLVIRMEMRTMI